jgi:hypothetical protein
MRASDYYHLKMQKEKLKIQVLDTQSRQQLFECALEESEKAYQFAAEMEQIGLDVEVVNPTLSETLSKSLGVSREEFGRYQSELEEEIEQHEGSCCFKDSEDKGPVH